QSKEWSIPRLIEVNNLQTSQVIQRQEIKEEEYKKLVQKMLYIATLNNKNLYLDAKKFNKFKDPNKKKLIKGTTWQIGSNLELDENNLQTIIGFRNTEKELFEVIIKTIISET
ncbi:MAG: hypothetical protein F6K26_30045, partial [Moorea sp. SIO2I5]|nr:hypothetical protein [Moorena sp. SIO2I5]